MYRIPSDLDLSPVVGEFTTQVRVGPFDLQFTIGSVSFMIESPVHLFRGRLMGRWEGGRWPDAGFYEVLNVDVTRCDIVNDRLIEIEFANGITMHLEDDSDQYECIHITFAGNQLSWII